MGMVHEIQKVRPHKGFTAADVELKNFHGGKRIDDLETLIRRQLSRAFDAGIRQAVNTR